MYAMKEGDYVVVKTISDELKGVVMPSKKSEKIALKLDSGYNISIDRKNVREISVIERQKTSKKDKEKIHPKQGLKSITILHTGGTFASKVDYGTGAVSASFSPEDLLEMFPEIKDIANIKSRLIRNMFSEDMNFNHYNLIAKEIASENSDGIIITHGTDTMHYTAAALSFILKNINLPVILTGAQRSSDRGSSDAFLNLICAANFIAKTDFIGVGICMHENLNDENCLILPGLKSRKMHSSRRDAFRSINSGPIARANLKNIEFISSHERKNNNRKLELKLFNPEIKVGILKAHPGLKIEELKAYSKFDGLVIEGFGVGGHFPINKIDEFTEENEKIYNTLKKLAKKIPVVATTQTIFGRINMDVYSTGVKMIEAGILGNYSDLTTETSFIKLSWLLSNYSKEEVRKNYNNNAIGELNFRSQHNY